MAWRDGLFGVAYIWFLAPATMPKGQVPRFWDSRAPSTSSSHRVLSCYRLPALYVLGPDTESDYAGRKVSHGPEAQERPGRRGERRRSIRAESRGDNTPLGDGLECLYRARG